MNGLKAVSLAEAREFDGTVFPLTLSPENKSIKLEDWLKDNQKFLDELLFKHKGILFRGFHEMKTHQEFHNAVEATGLKSMAYIGGAAVRTQLTSRIFTANESPSSEIIPFHHEMAQTPHPPTHLFFFCEIPPAIGGETPILLSNLIYKLIQLQFPTFVDDLEKYGVKYIRLMPEKDDPTSAIGRGLEAEAALEKIGSTYTWQEDGTGDLKTITSQLPAIRYDNVGDHRTGLPTFFNSMIAAYTGWNDSRNNGKKAVILAKEGGEEDGSCYLDESIMKAIEQIMAENSVAFPWQAGDLLLLDNRLTMHARRNFEGPRRILASLVRDPDR